MFRLSYIFVIVLKESVQVFFIICLYMYCRWRSSYQRGDPINRCNPATFLCLSQARIWISKVICSGLICVQWVQLGWEVIVCFVDIGGIVDHHCLNFLFIITFVPFNTREILCSLKMGQSWSWSYGSWIYYYLCNQCLSPHKLWVRIPLMVRCTRYNIMW
jgi:hypothetical protein